MPHLSRRKLDYKVEKELLESFEYVLTHSSPNELKKILSSLMTKTEQLMIAKRLGIAMMLKEKIPDSTIDEVLKVTRFTVNKIALLFAAKPEGFFLALEKLKQRQIKNSLKNILLELAAYAAAAAGGRLPRKKYPRS
jgi:uncharacterized protein YerC